MPLIRRLATCPVISSFCALNLSFYRFYGSILRRFLLYKHRMYVSDTFFLDFHLCKSLCTHIRKLILFLYHRIIHYKLYPYKLYNNLSFWYGQSVEYAYTWYFPREICSSDTCIHLPYDKGRWWKKRKPSLCSWIHWSILYKCVSPFFGTCQAQDLQLDACKFTLEICQSLHLPSSDWYFGGEAGLLKS